MSVLVGGVSGCIWSVCVRTFKCLWAENVSENAGISVYEYRFIWMVLGGVSGCFVCPIVWMWVCTYVCTSMYIKPWVCEKGCVYEVDRGRSFLYVYFPVHTHLGV